MSHTAPRYFEIQKRLKNDYSSKEGFDMSPDPSGFVLDEIRRECHPELWLFAHFHIRHSGEHSFRREKVRFECLAPLMGDDGKVDDDGCYWLAGGPAK